MNIGVWLLVTYVVGFNVVFVTELVRETKKLLNIDCELFDRWWVVTNLVTEVFVEALLWFVTVPIWLVSSAMMWVLRLSAKQPNQRHIDRAQREEDA